MLKIGKKTYQSKLHIFQQDVMRNGCGTYTFKNGNKYEGDWENNQRNGYGRMVYYTNTHPLAQYVESYEGEWKKGKKCGFGLMIWTNGDRYEGEFADGRREGRGVMISINQDRYDGEWKEGQLTGFGKGIRASNQIYIGEFNNGEKDGTGILTYPNGNKFEGSWKEGREEGHGIEFLADGSKWEGEWMKSKKVNEPAVPGRPDWKQVPEDPIRLQDRSNRSKELKIMQMKGTVLQPKRKKRKKPPFLFPDKNGSFFIPR